jgi:hypothetical protein
MVREDPTLCIIPSNTRLRLVPSSSAGIIVLLEFGVIVPSCVAGVVVHLGPGIVRPTNRTRASGWRDRADFAVTETTVWPRPFQRTDGLHGLLIRGGRGRGLSGSIITIVLHA